MQRLNFGLKNGNFGRIYKKQNKRNGTSGRNNQNSAAISRKFNEKIDINNTKEINRFQMRKKILKIIIGRKNDHTLW